jgi:hypothetical protein
VRPRKTAVKGLFALVVTMVATTVLAIGTPWTPQAGAVRLANEFMDWDDVREEAALFRWSVDVTNTSGQAVRVRLILDLLDDDDRPINRDAQGNPNDTYTITIEPGQTTAVQRQGSVSYDRAAEVITYRIRPEIIPGDR